MGRAPHASEVQRRAVYSVWRRMKQTVRPFRYRFLGTAYSSEVVLREPHPPGGCNEKAKGERGGTVKMLYIVWVIHRGKRNDRGGLCGRGVRSTFVLPVVGLERPANRKAGRYRADQ